jgi:hypothetical protein
VDGVAESIIQREKALADFLENASVSLHWFSSDRTILWANQAELNLLGYRHGEYIGHSFKEFSFMSVANDPVWEIKTGRCLLSNTIWMSLWQHDIWESDNCFLISPANLSASDQAVSTSNSFENQTVS